MGELRFPQIEEDLKKDPARVQKLYDDPQSVLKTYGVDVDKDAATRIRNLLKPQIDPNNPNINTQAVYVAVKVG